MGQALRVVLSAVAGFVGLFISYFIMESDGSLIRSHHLDQTVLHALQIPFGLWGGGATYYFFFLATPVLFLVSVLYGERERWQEVVASTAKVVRMDEWLRRSRDSS